MKILITGANGLIGYHLYKKYKTLGHQVIGIDNFSNSYRKDIDIIEGDCSSLDLMNNLCKNVEIIFHCACLPYEGLSNFSPRAVSSSVFIPTSTIATAAANNDVKKIWNFSSMARYGNQPCPQAGFDEEKNLPHPCDPYGVAKVASETMLNVMSNIYDFKVGHLVPHNVFGNDVRWDDMRRGVINIFIFQALKNQKLTIHNNGNQQRSFSFVDDVFSFADQLLTCNFSNKEVFNIGPEEKETFWSIQRLANFIIKEIKERQPKPEDFVYIKKINDPKEAKCSAKKIQQKFNWKTQTKIEDEIRKMISYAKENINNFNKYSFSNIPIEIAKKCPLEWLK